MAAAYKNHIVDGEEATTRQIADKKGIPVVRVQYLMRRYDLTLQNISDGMADKIGHYLARDKYGNKLGYLKSPVDYVKSGELARKRYPRTRTVEPAKKETQTEKNKGTADKKKKAGQVRIQRWTHRKNEKKINKFIDDVNTASGTK